MEITLRKIELEDKEAVMVVEAKSTPGLRYVPHVFEMFRGDERGEFFLAELDDAIVAIAKFTPLPDNSAWLETLRVIPEKQGLGVGKRLYEHFFELAQRQGIGAMRMYTGVNNKVSKGLAQHFGFQLEESFYGYSLPVDPGNESELPTAFQLVTDPLRAAEILLPAAARWHGFLVMNRTFYKLTAALCTQLTASGQVYEDPTTGNAVVLGARFMPEQALHLGMFVGDAQACLQFARTQAAAMSVPQLSCLFPLGAATVKAELEAADFTPGKSTFIVMKSGD